MQSLDHDRRSVVLPAPPDLLWSIVSDVTRTPELSLEISGCRWLDGATGPLVGARFEATNTVNGRSWTNTPVVTAAEPGRVFAFARTERFAGTIVWRYDFEPADGGTRVTESYEVTRPLTRLGWFVIEHLYHCRDRRGDLGRGMEHTLRRLAELVAAERSSTPSSR